MNDICDERLVSEIEKRIQSIDIDSIADSSYIYEQITDNKSLFPNILSTERPDLVSFKLLNGKIAIVVDNTPFVILMPAFFIEFFHTMDDYFQSGINATYMRIIRIIAFIITVMLPAIYIALITFNHEVLPPSLLINFAMQKEGVPFPTILEALIMNVTFEILRETDIRAPSALGSALSIVGALVLGDAAVNAGLVSPIMVIVIAITAISELIFSLNDVSNAVKIWRLIFIIFASLSGMLGVFIAMILLVAELSSINSFGVPFMYPTAPLDIHDQGNDVILTKKYKMSFRNKLTARKNTVRGEL
jgi:spore germination protein KA